MDIGANPSAEGGGEDEGVDDQAVKVVDIVDTFRLQVGMLLIFKGYWKHLNRIYVLVFVNLGFQEQPSMDKKVFLSCIKKYIKKLTPLLQGEQQEAFKNKIEGAVKYLLPKVKDLQL